MNDTALTTEIDIIIETLDFMFADFSVLSSSEKFVERRYGESNDISNPI